MRRDDVRFAAAGVLCSALIAVAFGHHVATNQSSTDNNGGSSHSQQPAAGNNGGSNQGSSGQGSSNQGSSNQGNGGIVVPAQPPASSQGGGQVTSGAS